MDVIKTRMQTDSLTNPRYKGVVHCAQKIVAEEGLRSMFRGLSPCLVRAFPANAAAFYIFELSRYLCFWLFAIRTLLSSFRRL